MAIDSLDLDFELDETFEVLEEVYGFISIYSAEQLTEINFKNLEIIRGWYRTHVNMSSFEAGTNDRGLF